MNWEFALFYEVGMPLPMGGVERGGSRRLLSFTDMAAISGSWVSYIFTSRANLRTPVRQEAAVEMTAFCLCLHVCTFNLTFSFIVETVCFDDLLLDLSGHRKHKLQHLAHVVAGAFSGFLHACCVLRHGESLDHLTKNNCNGRDNSLAESKSCHDPWEYDLRTDVSPLACSTVSVCCCAGAEAMLAHSTGEIHNRYLQRHFWGIKHCCNML